MLSVSKIEAFDSKRSNWSRYCQQIKFFLEANKVEENLKLATVLSLIGDLAFNVFCDLISPDLPESKTVDEVFTILGNHFSPKPIARAERFKLRSRKQGQDETIADYAAALRKLSLNCALNDNLDLILSDQFVFGVANITLQKRLLAEDDSASFDKLVQIASVAEMVTKDIAIVNNTSSAVNDVFKIQHAARDGPTSFMPDKTSCIHCGLRDHPSETCRFRRATCYFCKNVGHISQICRKKKNYNLQRDRKRPPIKSNPVYSVKQELQYDNADIREREDDDSLLLNNFSINKIEGARVQPLMFELEVNKVPINFELDTGASISLIPLRLFESSLSFLKMEKTKVILRAFGHAILPVGKVMVDICFRDKLTKNLELFVVNECTVPLLGRAWFGALGWFQDLLASVHAITSSEDRLQFLLKRYDKLFSEELGCVKKFKAHLFIKDGAIPKYFKYRAVPFALLPAIESELVKLQKQGILTPIKFADWAAPIVPILKKDGSIRICGDYKVGLNPFLRVDQYPLPIIDEILSKLAGGVIFSKLDMAQAYQQVLMDDESAKYLTISTHKGLFCVNRLPFGIASAPAIFQELMDRTLEGIPNIACYLDDILIASPDLDTHLRDLERVLERLEEAGIRLNLNKCDFLRSDVEYLGHRISKHGIQASSKKIEAIVSAPEPANVDQLRSFLGLVNYYRKFLPNLASVLVPLHALLSKNSKWYWSEESKKAFHQVKEAVSSTNVLTHYDPNLPLVLASDASPYGLGAVLSHICADGSERPVSFASRTLSNAEKNYSQLDKEALGIIFAIKKFHQFLFGRKFTLLTDHKPLTHIFNVTKPVPVLASARLQRWALLLSAYSYDIKFRTSGDNLNADALSRLPSSTQKASEDESFEDIFLISHVETFPYTYHEIAAETSRDPILSRVMNYVKVGWPKASLGPNLAPFQSRLNEISHQEGCLLWGLRVLVPTSLRKVILAELHRHHTGIVRMKSLARTLFWWPHLDREIEQVAHSCNMCTLHAADPPKAPLHVWIRPNNPWERIHIDFAGPVLDRMFLVVVDAFSKWPEVHIMRSTDTLHTTSVLDEYFTHYGYPLHLVSDNGPPFKSSEFQKFCDNRGIHHTFSPPYHPASNGQAERFVQILKSFLSKMDNTSHLATQVNELLFTYRSTPHTVTRKSPAELFLGREVRNRLRLIKPPPPYRTWTLQYLTPPKSFTIGQDVLSKSFATQKLANRWVRGVIHKQYGPVTYLVKFDDGKFGKRHVDQLRLSNLPRKREDSQDLDFTLPFAGIPALNPLALPPPPSGSLNTEGPLPQPQEQRRYPMRARHPPARLIAGC